MMQLPSSSEKFYDEVIGVANAINLLTHNARLSETSFDVKPGFTGAAVALVERMNAKQCHATLTYTPSELTIEVEPIQEVAPGFIPVTIILQAESFPGSPLFTKRGEREDKMPEHIGQFADLFNGFQPELQISAFMHDNQEFGVLSQQLTGQRAEIAGCVQDLAHGMDAIAAGTSYIRMRHPAFGAKASIVSTDDHGTIYAVPEADHPEAIMREARARITLMQRWADHLANAVMVHHVPERGYLLQPLAMTFTQPANPGAAKARSMQAFAKLTEMSDPAA